MPMIPLQILSDTTSQFRIAFWSRIGNQPFQEVAVLIGSGSAGAERWSFDNSFFNGNQAPDHDWKMKVTYDDPTELPDQQADVGDTDWLAVSPGEHTDASTPPAAPTRHRSAAKGNVDANQKKWGIQFSWNLAGGVVTRVRVYTEDGATSNFRVVLDDDVSLQTSDVKPSWKLDKQITGSVA